MGSLAQTPHSAPEAPALLEGMGRLESALASARAQLKSQESAVAELRRRLSGVDGELDAIGAQAESLLARWDEPPASESRRSSLWLTAPVLAGALALSWSLRPAPSGKSPQARLPPPAAVPAREPAPALFDDGDRALDRLFAFRPWGDKTIVELLGHQGEGFAIAAPWAVSRIEAGIYRVTHSPFSGAQALEFTVRPASGRVEMSLPTAQRLWGAARRLAQTHRRARL